MENALKVDRSGLNLKKNVGQRIVVRDDNFKNHGFYCELCEELFRDNSSYLDHLNSAEHLSKEGMGLRAQRSTLEDVLEVLEQNPLVKKKKLNQEEYREMQVKLENEKRELVMKKQQEWEEKENRRLEKMKKSDAIRNVSIFRSQTQNKLEHLKKTQNSQG